MFVQKELTKSAQPPFFCQHTFQIELRDGSVVVAALLFNWDSKVGLQVTEAMYMDLTGNKEDLGSFSFPQQVQIIEECSHRAKLHASTNWERAFQYFVVEGNK